MDNVSCQTESSSEKGSVKAEFNSDMCTATYMRTISQKGTKNWGHCGGF